MKRRNLGFVLAMLWMSCAAQDSVFFNDYKIFYYPSGVKSSEGRIVDGKPEGWWKSYNEKGVLISEGNRKNFLLDSLWVFYNDDSSPKMTVNYLENRKNGVQTVYGEDEYTVTHWKNDTITGSVNTYKKNGVLVRTVPYEDGLPNGLSKEFNDTGLVVAVARYYRGVRSRREIVNRTDRFGLKQGSWKYFWDNGNLKLEAQYLNDKSHGFFKYYDENGNFLRVEKFEHGNLVHDAKETKQLERRQTYHNNGRVAISATYFNGRPDGVRRDFDTAGKIVNGYLYEDGWLRYEGVTDLNGLRQGLWKEYYPTGELRSKGKYKNSRQIGDWYFYFPDKTVEISGSYDSKGKKSGDWFWFYPSGDTMVVAYYEEGELEGRYVEYDDENRIVTNGQYTAGFEEGRWTYTNGTAIETGIYEGGLRSGTWKSYFESGKTASEVNYTENILDGKYTLFWENGNTRLSGIYKNGLQEGIWQQYNEDGILTLTTLFKEGQELKWNNYTIK
ncbi:MAG: hypothetical protein SPL47_06765 [Bacteroidales bacterium]|nr:hypothetical protein [Bacteroidales bacterium]